MNFLRALGRLLLARIVFAPDLSAQHKPSTPEPTPASTAPTIAVDARLVNVRVVARDKKGALVQNLTKKDFILQIDSKPQTIRYFDKYNTVPLTHGLLLNPDLSQRTLLDTQATLSIA